VAPWFAQADRLPAEDAVDLGGRRGGGPLKIACPMLSRIANFDDLDPLAQERGVTLEMTPPGRALPGDADVIVLPGAKSTRGDLDFLRAQGWDVDIAAHLRRGGRVLGLCGGYQMLGRRVSDPQGVEGPPGETAGLGLLDVETVMIPDKRLARVRGRHLETGADVEGYEIHIGRTAGPDCARPWLEIAGRPEGATSADGRVAGAYVHGVFAQDGFRAAWLAALGAPPSTLRYADAVLATLDALAEHLEAHLDVDGLLAMARTRGA
jgi:adenosylcobyric acid synthase